MAYVSPFMSTPQVAAAFGVSTNTIASWVKRGFLHPTQAVEHGKLRFSRDEVNARLIVMGAISLVIDDTAPINDRKSADAFLNELNRRETAS